MTPVAAIGSDEAIEAVGRVVSVVGRTMVVQSGRGDATRERETDLDGVDETLDEESVLCTRDRRGLGAIEEVFGPVSAPLYALRLPEEVTAETGDEVFVVVGRSRRIPNVARLYKKGYDASGKDDEEVVEEEEFSDDEEEAAAKAARKKASGKKRSSGARAAAAPSRRRWAAAVCSACAGFRDRHRRRRARQWDRWASAARRRHRPPLGSR